jgi:hypothetical protein
LTYSTNIKTCEQQHTNFRKNSPEPIRKVFRTAVEIARHFNQIGSKLIAGNIGVVRNIILALTLSSVNSGTARKFPGATMAAERIKLKHQASNPLSNHPFSTLQSGN